jgi:predicted nuclease of predicted toxin-antitoxin system
MRFLTDENFPQASVHRLREAGHDVFDVTEKMPGATDIEVLTYAAEDARILLTFDRDYGELIYRQKRPVPKGVVFLRIPPAFPLQPAETLLSMEKLKGFGDWGLEGQFTVINLRDIRQRPLPS